MKAVMTVALCLLVWVVVSTPAAAQGIYEAIDADNLAAVKQTLRDNPAILEQKDPAGLTPLNYASYRGKASIVAALLDMGADINSGDNENSRPIHNAAVSGDVETIRILLEHGAEIDIRDDNGMTALIFAAGRGKTEAARLLTERGADVRARSTNGHTAAKGAALAGDLDLLQFLVGKGADVKDRNVQRSGILHSAVSYGRTDVVRYLIDQGLDVNAENDNGDTPLYWAYRQNTVDAVRMLIEAGADVNHRNSERLTPLHGVAHSGTVPVAEVLLEHGADVNALSNWGTTALTDASWEKPEIVRFLILHGADVNPQDRYQPPAGEEPRRPWSPIHAAASHGKLDIVRMLVDNGARINELRHDGKTPLHVAAMKGDRDLVAFLLARGAFVNVPDEQMGRTELHAAAVGGFSEVVTILLEHEADPAVRDDMGQTPMNLALNHGFRPLAYQLLAAGAPDDNLAAALTAPDLREHEVAPGEAVIWYLDHSGWAIRTANRVLVFDYFLHDDVSTPESASLASGHFVPSQFADLPVTVFVSHVHGDHYHPDIFNWRDTISNITYVMGFTPQGVNAPYVMMPPREQRDFGDIHITTHGSTDSGVGFLVEVDGLVILHPGDHAAGREDIRQSYEDEINFVASKGKDIDIAFFPVRGCGLGEPELVRQGDFWAIDQLHPVLTLPMHSSGNTVEYRNFAEEAERRGAPTRVQYPIDRGDVFVYSQTTAESL